MHFTRQNRLMVISLTLIGFAAARPVMAQTYDVSKDFSTTSNPNPNNGGVWSYGYEDTLGSGFTLDTSNNPQVSVYNSDFQGWSAVSGGFPFVVINTSSSTASGATVTLQPGEVALHPSASDQYSVVRFTTPSTGDYSLDALFSAADVVGTTTDVHVLMNNAALFGGNITGAGSTQAYAPAPLSLTTGDTIDFAVGFGNNRYSFDSTGLAAIITRATPNAVPEAGTLPLLGLGLGGLVLAARRRRRSA